MWASTRLMMKTHLYTCLWDHNEMNKYKPNNFTGCLWRIPAQTHCSEERENCLFCLSCDSRICWDRRKASQSWVMQTHMKQNDKVQLSHLLPVVGLTFQGSASHPLQCGYLNAFELQPRLIISFPNFTFIQSPSFFSSSQEMLLNTYQFQVAGCVRDPFNCVISCLLSTVQMKGVQDSNECEVGGERWLLFFGLG